MAVGFLDYELIRLAKTVFLEKKYIIKNKNKFPRVGKRKRKIIPLIPEFPLIFFYFSKFSGSV